LIQEKIRQTSLEKYGVETQCRDKEREKYFVEAKLKFIVLWEDEFNENGVESIK
jgi:hypothetical protein